MPAENISGDEANKLRSALFRVLGTLVTLPAQTLFYAAALGAIAIGGGVQLPPGLDWIAAGIGVNAITNILERVARGDDVKDKETQEIVLNAIRESNIENDLMHKEVQVLIAHLFRGLDILEFAIQNSELEVIKEISYQGQKYEAFVAELKLDIQELATKNQIDEIKEILVQFISSQQIKGPKFFLAPPLPPYSIVGRDGLISTIKSKLIEGMSVGLIALNGIPGVGKTTLASAIANDPEIMEHFADGILWAGAGQTPDVFQLLGLWCKALGIHLSEIAKLATIEDRANAVHSSIGIKKILIIIDDVWDSDIAVKFRLGGPNSSRLLTTRVPEVAQFFAGSEVHSVEELSHLDGVLLLQQLAPVFTSNYPNESISLVKSVGGLPLALVLLGNYISIQQLKHPESSVNAILDDLESVKSRLELSQPMGIIEHHPSLPRESWISLQAVITLSYEAIDKSGQRYLNALSIFPAKPNTFSLDAAKNVASRSIKIFNGLLDSGLVELVGSGRYSIHKTLSDFGRTKVYDANANERYCKYFTAFLESDPEGDVIDAEFENIHEALTIAKSNGFVDLFVRGVISYYPYQDLRGLYANAEENYLYALQLIRDSQDWLSMCKIYLNLGRIYRNLGNYHDASCYLQNSLKVAIENQITNLLPEIYLNLGGLSVSKGNYTDAEDYYKSGFQIAMESDDPHLISAILANWGIALYNKGDLENARKTYEEGMKYAKNIKSIKRAGDMLMGLGAIEDTTGNYSLAENYYKQSLAIARIMNNKERICVLLSNIGGLLMVIGNPEKAKSHLEESVALAREIGHKENLSLSLMTLGEIHLDQGDHSKAASLLEESLSVAKEIGQKKRICAALMNLGVLKHDQGNFDSALEFLESALGYAREINQYWLIVASLIHIGNTKIKLKSPKAAMPFFNEALSISREFTYKEFAAEALYGLGQAHFAAGNLADAEILGKESQEIYSILGHIKLKEVETWLESKFPSR